MNENTRQEAVRVYKPDEKKKKKPMTICDSGKTMVYHGANEKPAKD